MINQKATREDFTHQLMPPAWQDKVRAQAEKGMGGLVPPSDEGNVDVASNMLWRLFKGTGAKTADEVRDIAQGMQREGASPTEIYKETEKFASPDETGLFQNPDQQWLFELSDKGGRLTTHAKELMRTRFGDYEQSTGDMELGRIYDNPLLYSYVPELQKVTTNVEALPPQDPKGVVRDYGGGFARPGSPESKGSTHGRIEMIGKPGLDPEADDPFSVLGGITHEKEHFLQSRFGLPQGGNKDNPDMQAFFRTQMMPQAEKIRISMEMEREAYAKDYANLFGGGEEALAKGRADWEKMRPDQRNMLAQAINVGGAPGQFARAGQPAKAKKPNLDYFGQYKSLAGEQAAFGQGDRMKWDTERRRAEPQFLAAGTEQLAPAFQMIRHGDQYSLPDPNWALFNTEWRP